MKKILCINYSQTGQLHEIMDQLIKPLSHCQIDRVHLKLKSPFNFPWSSKRFFEAMPESVLEIPTELQELNFKYEHYDLIILGYQPWFLSPSIPTTSLLCNDAFIERLKGTKVITVIGARNMWLNAQDSVMKHIEQAGGELVGNIPLIDRASNLPSAVSILHWMLTGKKTRKYGVFPKPGISDEDIRDSEQYGQLIAESIKQNQFSDLQQKFVQQGNFQLSTPILFIEGRAKKLFMIWAKLIKKKEKKSLAARRRWLVVFKYYLIFALFIVSPIVLLLYYLFVLPFTLNKVKKKRRYYLYSGIGI